MRRILPILFLVGLGFSFADAASVLVLSNGDRLKGTLVREESGTVYFKSDILGEITLKKDQVKEIVLAENPATVVAKNTPNPQPQKTAPKKKKYWSGNVGLSVNSQHAESESRSGNAIKRRTRDSDYLRMSGKVQWDKEKHHLEWNGSYVYGESNGSKNNDLYNLSQRYRYDWSDRWFGQSETSYEHNYAKVLDQEIEQFGGIGWRPVKSDKLTIDLVPGLSYYSRDQAEERTTGVTPQFQQSLKSKVNQSLTLFQGFTYSGYSDLYHYKLNAGFDNRLVKNLSLRMEYRYEVDTLADDGGDPFEQRQLISSIQYRF